jgi:putative methionine-R-sulfoxide reductase with GAF domain
MVSQPESNIVSITPLTSPLLQVHADSSNFATGVGKKEAYEQVIDQATALFDGQRNWVCRIDHIASKGPPENKKHITAKLTFHP